MTRIALAVAVVLAAGPAQADLGPKPTMDFQVRFEAIEPFDLGESVLLQCEAADCSDGQQLEDLGPQRFVCGADGCWALAYGFAPYAAIEVKYPDGATRRSAPFTPAGFQSNFHLIISEDGVTVRP